MIYPFHPSQAHLARRRTSGFTLLELLAAMAVLSILAVVLFQTMNQASRGWEQGQRTVEIGQQARTALDYMAKEITQVIATPPTLLILLIS